MATCSRAIVGISHLESQKGHPHKGVYLGYPSPNVCLVAFVGLTYEDCYRATRYEINWARKSGLSADILQSFFKAPVKPQRRLKPLGLSDLT